MCAPFLNLIPGGLNVDKWLKATSYLVASALVATLAWQFTHEAVRFSQSSPHLNASMTSMELLQGHRRGPTKIMPKLRECSGMHVDSGPANGHEPASPSMELLQSRQKVRHRSLMETQQLKLVTSADTWIEILDAQGITWIWICFVPERVENIMAKRHSA